MVKRERPAPGDTKDRLMPLLKRAVTELPWPELPKGIPALFLTCFGALSLIADFGEPEEALEILSPHVKDVESKVVDRNYVAQYYIFRSEWLVSAAEKFKEDEGKRGAYVAEARGAMGRAVRNMPSLEADAWTAGDAEVSYLTSPWKGLRYG
jgi:hypothetical protein